jgi:hypothetical protein
LLELGQPGLHPLFVKQVVTLAMDRRDREREMASGLLSELHTRVISDDQVMTRNENVITRYFLMAVEMRRGGRVGLLSAACSHVSRCNLWANVI